eukprot:3404117-Prymnesium_polylepis.1
MGVGPVEVCRAFGVWAKGDVKTQTSRYPTKFIQENCGPEPGAWITLISKDANGKFLMATGHRRGPSVHTFISSYGTTVAGKPQAHYEEAEESGKAPEQRKCPKILNA